MELRFLREDDLPAMLRAFREAFADYVLDMSYMTDEHLRNRWTKNGVVYPSSVGAFEGGRLVGFTAVGIDRWQGELAAFDAATGIVPEHRGQGLAGRMFDLLLPRLRERGVRRFVLEVLQDNAAAVTAYRRAGFEVTRDFDAYRARPDVPPAGGGAGEAGSIRRAGREAIADFAEHFDWTPSWENSLASLSRVPDDLVVLVSSAEAGPAGLLVYHPGLNWITTIVVKRGFRRRGVARRLVERLRAELGEGVLPKMVHVEHRDVATRGLLERTGFAVYARQHEMARAI
jgi:ribosomal protein S18 acetylase RimI-like enzyme